MLSTHTGLITSAFGRHYQLELDNGDRLLAHPRGKKSEAVVGDQVQWQHSHDEAVIEKILPRRNLFYRQDEMRTKAFAANIDQILFMTAAEPEFSARQINRTLVAAAAEQINVIIALNKSDMGEPFKQALQRLQVYQDMGYQVLPTSMRNKTNISELLNLLKHKTTLILGQSGTGKSTLINTIIPDAQVQTQELSKALKTGKHTTTTSQWYWLPGHQGAVIDSPGFQEFGLHHITPTKLAQLMPDIYPYTQECRFYNCTHLHEPGCSVIAASQKHLIDTTRYNFYQETMEELLSITPKYGA